MKTKQYRKISRGLSWRVFFVNREKCSIRRNHLPCACVLKIQYDMRYAHCTVSICHFISGVVPLFYAPYFLVRFYWRAASLFHNIFLSSQKSLRANLSIVCTSSNHTITKYSQWLIEVAIVTFSVSSEFTNAKRWFVKRWFLSKNPKIRSHIFFIKLVPEMQSSWVFLFNPFYCFCHGLLCTFSAQETGIVHFAIYSYRPYGIVRPNWFANYSLFTRQTKKVCILFYFWGLTKLLEFRWWK